MLQFALEGGAQNFCVPTHPPGGIAGCAAFTWEVQVPEGENSCIYIGRMGLSSAAVVLRGERISLYFKQPAPWVVSATLPVRRV